MVKRKESGALLKTLEIPKGIRVMEEGKPFFFEGDKEVGCLLIHGFTGTTQSMLPMGKYLASKGITILCPRLPGHGTSVKDMARYTWLDWTSAVELALEELRSLCRMVFVSGLSMGGTLTLYLAENHPEKIAGIMPICAPVTRLSPGLQQYAIALVPVLKHFIKTLPGPGNDLKDPDAKEVAYEKMPTAAIHELAKLARNVRDNLGKAEAAARIFAAREDHVVPIENARYIFQNISSKDKKLIWLENSYHVATLDYDKEKIFRECVSFIRELSNKGASVV